MLKSTRFIIAFTFAAFTLSAQTGSHCNASTQSTIVVTGAIQGGVQPRLEVHQLRRDEDQWNIYLLALHSFMTMDSNDPMSYYQISGIHGVPYVEWDSVKRCSNCTDTGYCAHSSTLFPTWHRAYGALFEQSLQDNAIVMANQFSGHAKIRYLEAAARLRMPYWDWALRLEDEEEPFPGIFTQPSVNVDTPAGRKTIANPLLLYSFGTAEHSFMETCSTHDANATYRNLTLTRQSRQNLRDDLWTMLTTNQGYTSFSTNSLATFGDNYNPHSLEMIHDRVHVLIGGDMGFVPTAAFDPVFWLHHAMVDRAFALRQALHPYQWVQPWSEVGDTYTYAKGTIEDSTSPLMPFRSNESCGFLDSDAVRDHTSVGYDYANLASGQSAVEVVNSLYRDNETQFSKTPTEAGSIAQGYIARSSKTQEYIARIEADPTKSNGSFTVFLFDGKVNEDSGSWHTAPSLLGSHGFFSGPKSSGDRNALVCGGVSLTSMLAKRRVDGRLTSLEDVDVTKYLLEFLKLRVRLSVGNVGSVAEVPHLKVTIVTSDVELPSSIRDLPRWSEFRVLMDLGIVDVRH